MGTPKDHINSGCGRPYEQHNLEELKSYEGTEPARRAVLGIIDNLLDRRGIKEAPNGNCSRPLGWYGVASGGKRSYFWVDDGLGM